MNLYLARITTHTLMEGNFEKIIGAFDSSSETNFGREYVMDGELTIVWDVIECRLNQEIGG